MGIDLKPHRLDQHLELAVVGFDNIVEVFHLAVLRLLIQLPFPFQFADRGTVAWRLVGVQFSEPFPVLQAAQSLAQKAFRGLGASGGRKVKVDGVTAFIDRPVQVSPLASDLMRSHPGASSGGEVQAETIPLDRGHI